jgi:SPP1 family predicted phage head-tail adaptor
MRAGALDRRITLRHATVTTNDYGEEVPTWIDLATVWASKQDVSDAERVRAQQTGASITTRFQVRYSVLLAELTTRDQLLCEGRLYNVSAIKELGRRHGLEITATAQADT